METRTEMHTAQLKLVCYDLTRELRWLHRIETARGLHGVVDWLARLPDTSNMRTAVICIDMQNDFCLPDAALFVKESPSCIPKCQQLIEGAREHGVPVIWVIREHEPDGVDVEHPRQHLYQCGKGPTLHGTPGAQIVAELQPLQSEIVIIKKRFSAFFNTPLDCILRRRDIQHLIVCGVQTPNCIRACAYDGICLDYHVTVSSDATASASEAVQQANLHDMSNVGIKISTTQEILSRLA